MESTIERTTTTRTYNVTHAVAPHSLVITRHAGLGSAPGQTRTTSRSFRSGTGSSGLEFDEGEYAMQTATNVNAVKEVREKERKDMQDLNDRFANYIEKVRMLEVQNRKLAEELEKLKTKWGKETAQIKAMYQAELDEARQALDDAEREKARLEIKVATLEEQIEELRVKLALAQQELALYKEKVARQNQQISDYEYEITLLRKQIDGLETEREKDRKRIAELEELLAKAREDLDNETLAHIDAENRRQTLEEHIEFLKSIHDQEMKELAALAYRDTSPESRDFWKNEMNQAIREIEQMYSDKLDGMKTEMESNYNLKIQEFRTAQTRQDIDATKGKEECKQLRMEVTDIRDRINDLDARNAQLQREIEALRRAKEERERELEANNSQLRREADGLRGELEAILRELQMIMNSKMDLELEIAAYRKLLEGEEIRTNLREVTSAESYMSMGAGGGGGGGGMMDDEMGSAARGEMSAKTTYQRTAKGAMAVSDCPPDGKSVKLENTGRKEENIEGWTIRRTVDGKERDHYKLDERFKALKPGTKIAIWAQGTKPRTAAAHDIEMVDSTWGIGSLVVTKLVNPDGEDRASLTQRTVYS